MVHDSNPKLLGTAPFVHSPICGSGSVRLKCSVAQTEGESLQQQSQLEKDQLHAVAEEAQQKLAKLEQEALQASLKAAHELESLRHNHAISQVKKLNAF